jgi:methylglutaconyl-CoA hydratase
MSLPARVLAAVDDGVLTATLNRPDKRNAIDTPMIDELLATLDRAELDGAVRVVALRGAGPDFSAGMDLQELRASVDAPVDANRRAALRFAEIFLRMRTLPKPVVALVHGRALAGGCGLATACDLVFAAESAKFGYPEVHRGFVPALVLTLLRRAVGEKVAFDLAATGRTLTADEAAAVGLVSRVYEDSDLEEQATEALRALAGSSPSALAFTKRLFYRLDGLSFDEGLRLGADVNAVSRTTPDFRVGLEAFFKNDPILRR